MNLMNGFETNPLGFLAVTSSMVVSSFFLFMGFYKLYQKSTPKYTHQKIKDQLREAQLFFNNMNSTKYVTTLYDQTNVEEFKDLIKIITGQKVDDELINQIFQKYDINKDNHLDKEELEKAINIKDF